MATHHLQQQQVIDTDVVFVCAVCAGTINFNRPGIGEPCAINNGDGTWSAPENPELWMGPCNG